MVLPGERVPLDNSGPDPQRSSAEPAESWSAAGSLLELRRAEQRFGTRSRVIDALHRVYGSIVIIAELPDSPPDTAAAPVVTSPSTPPVVDSSDLDSSAEDSSGAERRALPRRDSACSVQICVVPGGEPTQSQRLEWLLHAARQCGPLVDVSLRSVSVMLGTPVAAGERVILRLTNRRLDKEVDRTARVIRSVTRAGEWRVVCRFDEPLALEELQHFARFPFGSACV